MQIIDSNDFNLRVATYLFEREKTEIVIIPMFHIGSKDFYRQVSNELEKCDVIIYEGMDLKNIRRLHKSYRRCASRLSLSCQSDELNVHALNCKLVHADFTGIDALNEWKNIPLLGRLLFNIFFPLGLLFLAFSETRKSYARTFRNKEEIDSDLWFMKIGKTNSISSFIMDKRNSLIMDNINQQLQVPDVEKRRIGILYGAGHMKAVINYITREHDFKMKDSWFLTVFEIIKSGFKFRKSEGG